MTTNCLQFLLRKVHDIFTIKEDRWVKGADGIWDRTILAFDQLYDFSVVDQSYYGITDVVGCKRFAEIQEEEKKANEEAMKAAEEAAKENETPVQEEEREEPAGAEIPAEERSEEVVDTKAEEEITKDLTDYYNNIRKENEKYLQK